MGDQVRIKQEVDARQARTTEEMLLGLVGPLGQARDELTTALALGDDDFTIAACRRLNAIGNLARIGALEILDRR